MEKGAAAFHAKAVQLPVCLLLLSRGNAILAELSMEEGVVPSCIVVDVRVAVICRVVEEVITTVSSSSPAAAVKAAAVALGGGGIVISVDHRGTAIELLMATVAVVATAAMVVTVMVIMVVIWGTPTSAAFTLVATGYHVAHTYAAPR